MKKTENKTKREKLDTNQKYLSKFKTVAVRVPLTELDSFTEKLRNGESLSAYFLRMARNKDVTCVPLAPEVTQDQEQTEQEPETAGDACLTESAQNAAGEAASLTRESIQAWLERAVREQAKRDKTSFMMGVSPTGAKNDRILAVKLQNPGILTTLSKLEREAGVRKDAFVESAILEKIERL